MNIEIIERSKRLLTIIKFLRGESEDLPEIDQLNEWADLLESMVIPEPIDHIVDVNKKVEHE